jgi:hypothetical protein
MSYRTNRWEQDDEHPGSLFHELIVLPTLAPHLARPEYLRQPGEGPVIYPQPCSQQIANGVVTANQHLTAGVSITLVF